MHLTTATRQVVIALVVALAMVFQPLASAADVDCSALQQEVQDDVKAAAAQNEQLRQAQLALSDAWKDIFNDFGKISDAQDTLDGLPAKVQAELDSKGFHDALETLTIQVAASIFLALLGPVGIAHATVELLELAEQAHTSYDVGAMIGEASNADNVMAEITAMDGQLEAAREFASENDLPELSYLIQQEDYLAGLMRDLNKAWQRMEDAADSVVAYQAVLDQINKRLAAALTDLDNCLAQQQQNPCDATNPTGGAGHCR